MKKLITIILVIVMTASIFSSCGENTPGNTLGENTPESTTKNPSEITPEKGDPGDEHIYPGFNLDELDYGNKEVNIFSWTCTSPEFSVDEEAKESDPISRAVYTRNLRIEEGLGIKLNFASENEFFTSYDTFVSKLEKRIQDPETTVDIIAANSRMAPNVLVEGLYTDLNAYSDIDLTKQWWRGNVREAFETKGRLYFITGDASLGTLTELEVLFMNVSMLESGGVDYDKFIKDVRSGKWTIDDLITLAKYEYQALDNVDGKSKGDRFGIIGDSRDLTQAMWTSMGYKFFDISKDDKSLYKMSEDILGDNAANFVKKMTELRDHDSTYFSLPSDQNSMTDSEKLEIFADGRALFMEMSLGEFEYGDIDPYYTIALPFPKATEQGKYHTTLGYRYTLFGICSAAADKVLAARTLEVWGYCGYIYTTSAVFEVTMSAQPVRENYSYLMFDIIRDSVTYDPGVNFERYTGTKLPDVLSMTWENGNTWASTFTNAKKNVLEQSIAASNEKIIAVINADRS